MKLAEEGKKNQEAWQKLPSRRQSATISAYCCDCVTRHYSNNQMQPLISPTCTHYNSNKVQKHSNKTMTWKSVCTSALLCHWNVFSQSGSQSDWPKPWLRPKGYEKKTAKRQNYIRLRGPKTECTASHRRSVVLSKEQFPQHTGLAPTGCLAVSVDPSSGDPFDPVCNPPLSDCWDCSDCWGG